VVKLQIWQKRAWLLTHKKRQKWQARHPNQTYPTKDPYYVSIGRYTCALCEERFYYRASTVDRESPQYHKHKTTWMVICHACWHLKGIYKKHQDPHSAEGLSGCRFCQLQLAAKRNRKRSSALREEASTPDFTRPRQDKSSPDDWQPTRVHRSVGLSAGRNGRTNASKPRLARRGTR
jgi:hypothetical protein